MKAALLIFAWLGCRAAVECAKELLWDCPLRIGPEGTAVEDQCNYQQMNKCGSNCLENEIDSCTVRVRTMSSGVGHPKQVGRCHCVCRGNFPDPGPCGYLEEEACKAVCERRHPDWQGRRPYCVRPIFADDKYVCPCGSPKWSDPSNPEEPYTVYSLAPPQDYHPPGGIDNIDG